LSNKTEM